MEIKKIHNNLGQFAFRVERSEYDAVPPVSEFTLDHAPEKINPERLAVAVYLMFGRWCGGDFVSPWKFGPNTAAAISADSTGIEFFCRPIEFYPKPLPVGSKAINLTDRISREPDSIEILNSDKWNGSLRSHQSISVASNSFLFKRSHFDVRPLLAVGVLFAEDLDADLLRIKCNIDPSEIDRLRALLSSVRLGLDVVTGGARSSFESPASNTDVS